MNSLRYIDLFSGGGGLSEGFWRQGFEPIAHVEYDKPACFTLKTRAAYHYLTKAGKDDIYNSYLNGEIHRKELYSHLPISLLRTVINAEIGKDNKEIFSTIDGLLDHKEVDLIIGGPPCQAYSVVGRAPLKHKTDDERTRLYIQYGRFLKKYGPKVFVFENVPGMLTAANGQYYKNLKRYYKRLGYELDARLLDSFDYGVVQQRQRIIIVGWKRDLNLSYPDFLQEENTYRTKDIFNDLPSIKPGENRRVQAYSKGPSDYLKNTGIRNGNSFVTQHITRQHNQKDLKIYKLAIEEMKHGKRLKNSEIPVDMRTQKNTSDFLDRFKVVDSKPHTLIAHIAKDGHHFIHSDEKQLRSISVREAARIQSFPDNYYFEGFRENQTRSAAFKQIGNAVPPIMAERIAKTIKNLIDG